MAIDIRLGHFATADEEGGRESIGQRRGLGDHGDVRTIYYRPTGPSVQEITNFLAYPSTFTNGVFIGAASARAPRLQVQIAREDKEMVQLQWPAGCVCEVQGNLEATDPRGWSVLEFRPVETGNQLGMLVPAVQKLQFFRLICDFEAVR